MATSMATSIFIARLLGPLLLIVGASLLINPRAVRKMAQDVIGSVTLVYLFGVLDFAAGLAILLVHNVWLASWRVIITLLGWLLLIRGAVRILAPEQVMGYAEKILRKQQYLLIGGGVTAVIGLVLCYFGYAA